MPKTLALTGNAAVAQAMRQIDPDVVAAYPITPQTTIVEEFATFVANGLVNTEYINVESEHSAMSASIGAAAAGGRAVTATSSQGLALMWEMLYIASGMRLPITMATATRALSAPINIHGDHSDVMGARDTGWIQLFCEDAQEAYDTMLQAVRIAEHPKVRLPVTVNFDGFIISHALAPVEILNDEVAQGFVGEAPEAPMLLDPKNPVTMGAFDGLHGYYFEFKRQQEEAMIASKQVIVQIGEEYGRVSGRKMGLIESYLLEDAEAAIVVLGSAAGTAREVVNELRERGRKVGLVRLRSFRPFPGPELADALRHLKAVAVLDRAHGLAGFGGGPVYVEVCAALYGLDNRPAVYPYYYGLGGRDIGPTQFLTVYDHLAAGERPDSPPVRYLNFRNGEGQGA